MASAIVEATAAAESSFADSLKLFPPTSQVADPDSPILELETGLAALFQQICYDRVLDLSDPGQNEVVPEDTLKLWKLEQNTWELVADLYLCVVSVYTHSLEFIEFILKSKPTIRDRAYPAFEGPSPRSMLLANPYTPEKAVIRQALESSTSLNELLVRWEIAYCPNAPTLTLKWRRLFVIGCNKPRRLREALRKGQGIGVSQSWNLCTSCDQTSLVQYLLPLMDGIS